MVPGVNRFGGGGVLEAVDRLAGLLGGFVNSAESVVSGCAVGVKLTRLEGELQRLGNPVLPQQHAGEIAVRFGQGGFQRQGLAVSCLSLAGTAGLLKEIGEVHVSLGQGGTRVDCHPKAPLRLAKLTGLFEQQAKVDLCLGMAWIMLRCPLIMVARQLRIPRLFLQKAKAEVDVGHVRGRFKCLVEARPGLIQKAVLNVIQALEHQRCGLGFGRGRTGAGGFWADRDCQGRKTKQKTSQTGWKQVCRE